MEALHLRPHARRAVGIIAVEAQCRVYLLGIPQILCCFDLLPRRLLGERWFDVSHIDPTHDPNSL